MSGKKAAPVPDYSSKSATEPVGILPPPGASQSEEDATVVEWQAMWEDVEVRKVGVTFKFGGESVRCSKRIYTSLTPDSS